MDHVIEAPSDTETASEGAGDLGRVLITATLPPGRRLRVVKLLAYGWSGQRSAEAQRDQVSAALTEARHTGWLGLLQAQPAYLGDLWEHADVGLDGDLELQQAVRFGMFHVFQAGARAEQRAIPAKGLTRPGYDGHTFWDTETFVLPLLTYTSPHAARDALRWRHAEQGRTAASGCAAARRRFPVPVADQAATGCCTAVVKSDSGPLPPPERPPGEDAAEIWGTIGPDGSWRDNREPKDGTDLP